MGSWHFNAGIFQFYEHSIKSANTSKIAPAAIIGRNGSFGSVSLNIFGGFPANILQNAEKIPTNPVFYYVCCQWI